MDIYGKLSKRHKDSPMKVQQKKGRTSSDSTNSEVPTGDSAVLLTPTLKQVATARSATTVPLLSVLMKWSRKPSRNNQNSPWLHMLRKGLHLNGTCAHHLQNHRNSFQSPKYKPNNLQVTCATVPNDPTLPPSGSLSLGKLGTSQCRGCHWELRKYLFYMRGNHYIYYIRNQSKSYLFTQTMHMNLGLETPENANGRLSNTDVNSCAPMVFIKEVMEEPCPRLPE